MYPLSRVLPIHPLFNVPVYYFVGRQTVEEDHLVGLVLEVDLDEGVSLLRELDGTLSSTLTPTFSDEEEDVGLSFFAVDGVEMLDIQRENDFTRMHIQPPKLCA